MATSPRLQTFIAQCAQLAQRMGIADMVLAVRDPATGETDVVTTKTGKTSLRDAIATKFEFGDDSAETGWPMD